MRDLSTNHNWLQVAELSLFLGDEPEKVGIFFHATAFIF